MKRDFRTFLKEQTASGKPVFFDGGMGTMIQAEGVTDYNIPEDVSVLGYDGIRLSQMYSPRLSTWRQDTEALGSAAASALVDLIEHPENAVADSILIPGSLIEGESVRDLSAR